MANQMVGVRAEIYGIGILCCHLVSSRSLIDILEINSFETYNHNKVHNYFPFVL